MSPNIPAGSFASSCWSNACQFIIDSSSVISTNTLYAGMRRYCFHDSYEYKINWREFALSTPCATCRYFGGLSEQSGPPSGGGTQIPPSVEVPIGKGRL